jgi:DNA polymerase III delta subunit
MARDRNRALESMHRLLEDGEATHKLMASIAWQLRQMLVVQDLTARGLSEREANLRMPPQVQRNIKELVSRTQVRPSALLEELAATGRGMNSSRAGDRRIFEAFVLRLTTL